MSRKNLEKRSSLIEFIIVVAIFAAIFGGDDEEKSSAPNPTVAPTQYVSNATGKPVTDVPTTKPTPIPTKQKELTEKEYKAKCEELFYDDVFFGDDNLKGQYVKLNVFLSEKYYFTVDDTYKSSYKEFYEEHKMKRDFYLCSVLREDANSYVGKGKVQMWFTDHFKLNPNDYKTGQKLTVYAEVISWSDNTWDGYNNVILIPKYIETK